MAVQSLQLRRIDWRQYSSGILSIAALLLFVAAVTHLVRNHVMHTVERFDGADGVSVRSVRYFSNVCGGSNAPLGMYQLDADSCFLHETHEIVRSLGGCNSTNKALYNSGVVTHVSTRPGTRYCEIVFNKPIDELNKEPDLDKYLKNARDSAPSIKAIIDVREQLIRERDQAKLDVEAPREIHSSLNNEITKLDNEKTDADKAYKNAVDEIALELTKRQNDLNGKKQTQVDNYRKQLPFS